MTHEVGEEQEAARQMVDKQKGFEEAARFSSVLQCLLCSCTNSDKSVFW